MATFRRKNRMGSSVLARQGSGSRHRAVARRRGLIGCAIGAAGGIAATDFCEPALPLFLLFLQEIISYRHRFCRRNAGFPAARRATGTAGVGAGTPAVVWQHAELPGEVFVCDKIMSYVSERNIVIIACIREIVNRLDVICGAGRCGQPEQEERKARSELRRLSLECARGA
jgi:hypothetical protein